MITIIVGTNKYTNDFEIASTPGARRKFIKYLFSNKEILIKHDFTNIESIVKYPKVEDVLKVGDEIEAKVIDLNETERKIALSIKALLPVPETVKEEEADVADVDIESYGKKMEEEPQE